MAVTKYHKGDWTAGFQFDVGGKAVFTPGATLVNSSGTEITPNYSANTALGLTPNQTTIFFFGNNPDVDTAPEDIWTGGGLYPWMTAATALEAVSASAADAAAGTGARTITLIGLDATYAQVSQVITLNGVTPVAIPTSLFRINSCTITTAGSGEINAGDITIRDSGAGTTRAIMPAGIGQFAQSQFTVPLGKTLLITRILHSINQPSTSRDAVIHAYVRLSTGTARLSLPLGIDGQPFSYEVIPYANLPEKTDFGFRATYVSQTNTNIASSWFGVLKTN